MRTPNKQLSSKIIENPTILTTMNNERKESLFPKVRSEEHLELDWSK